MPLNGQFFAFNKSVLFIGYYGNLYCSLIRQDVRIVPPTRIVINRHW